MKLTSTKIFESKLYPGVSYKLRRMLHSRRVEFNLATVDFFSRIYDIQLEINPIEEEIKKAEEIARTEPCTCDSKLVLTHEHEEKTGRCQSPGCHCREPKLDEAFGGYKKLVDLNNKIMEIISNELYPAYIQWGVLQVRGLNLADDDDNEVEITLDNFLLYAPEDMVSEVAQEVRKMTSLTPDEVVGFKPPTTSGAQVDGRIVGTTAPSANATDSTSADAAAAISQN